MLGKESVVHWVFFYGLFKCWDYLSKNCPLSPCGDSGQESEKLRYNLLVLFSRSIKTMRKRIRSLTQATPTPATGSATSTADGRSQNKTLKPFNLRVSTFISKLFSTHKSFSVPIVVWTYWIGCLDKTLISLICTCKKVLIDVWLCRILNIGIPHFLW